MSSKWQITYHTLHQKEKAITTELNQFIAIHTLVSATIWACLYLVVISTDFIFVCYITPSSAFNSTRKKFIQFKVFFYLESPQTKAKKILMWMICQILECWYNHFWAALNNCKRDKIQSHAQHMAHQLTYETNIRWLTH